MSAYEQYLNSLQKEDQGKNQLVASLSEAATANPDEFANMVKLSRAAKVSVDAVADYKTEAQQAKYLGEVGLDRLWRDAPKTANFLTEPDNAKLAKDDHENLTGIEGVFDYLKNRGRAVGAAIPKMNAGLWGMAAAPFELLGVDSVGGYLRDQQKITDRMAKSWGPQDKPGWMTNAIDQGLTSAGQQLLTLPMAFLPGGQNATLSAMVAPVFGESYGKARDKGLSPAQSIQYGTQDAAAEWVFERYGLGNLVQNVKSGTGYGRTLVEFMLREVPSEMATTVVQSFNEYANINPDKPVSEWAAQLPDELAQTAVATLVGGSAIATTAKAVDGVVRAAESRLNKADEANQMADMLGRINQHIAASATLARDPATFQKFIESATEDGPVQTVFIDGKTLAQSGIAEQLAAVSPAVAEQLQTAIETGGQVAIPVAEYATAIAPTEFAQSLLDHLKVDPEGFSRAEAKEYMQSHADDLQREVERVIGEQADDTAFRQSVETVKANIKQQLDTAARFTPQVNDAYAAMVGNFYAVMGAKTGNTPEELFAKYPLRIGAESVAGQQFDQGGTLRVVDVFGNGARVDHYDDKKGLMYSAQRFPAGIRWTAFETFPLDDGGDQVLGEMFKYKSLEEAQAAVRGLRISATQKAKNTAKYGAIPNLWKGEEKKVAKALIDAGVGIDRFASSTQSRSKYIYLESGLKVRLADHALPGNYDQPDVDYRYGGDIKTLVAEVKKAEEGAPTPDSASTRSSAPDAGMQERPEAEPAQFENGAGSDANITDSYGQGKQSSAVNSENNQKYTADTIEVDGKTRPTQNSNGKPIAQTEEGLRNFWRWFGDSKVVDAEGRPLVVYHGTGKQYGNRGEVISGDFDTFDAGLSGKASKTGAPEGTFFFTNDPEVASSYTVSWRGDFSETYRDNANVMPVYLKIDKPAKVNAKGENWREVLYKGDYLDVNEIAGMVQEAGKNDGMIVSKVKDKGVGKTSGKPATTFVAFDPTQIKSATGNRGTFDPANPNILMQSGQERDLVVTHNLSAKNLLHAVKMGGIPVPSLAVTKKDNPLTGFGEITLIGSKEMADPKGYAATKVFGADIYSPRYPTVSFEFTGNMRKRAEGVLKDGMEATGVSYIDWSEVERGPRELERIAPFMWYFLTKQGIQPEIVRTKPKDLPSAILPFVEDKRDAFDLKASPDFIDAAWQAQEDMYLAAGMDAEEAKQRVDEMKENGKNRGVNFIAQGFARAVEDYRRDSRLAGRIDTSATRYALEKQVREANLSNELEAAAVEFFDDINPNERIFQGFTPSGNRKYIPHTLDNVVKILKKELRGGEGFNYGVGSIRAKFTPQFKSIEQIRKAKDRLIDKAAFEEVKGEIDGEFEAIRESLSPFHSYGKEFGFGDTITQTMYDAATMGVPRALKENGFDEVPAEVQQEMAEFMARLRELPTEYFEAKILRDVDLAEFSGAVVPEGVDPKVINALQARGVKDIRTYKKGDEADRAAKIGEFDDLFFQKKDTNRGSFNPATNTITLLKNADLSTFLHESGHFFLETQLDIASRIIGLEGRTPGEQQLLDDTDALLKWFGIRDLAEWSNLDFEERRSYHEQFARGFEAYLFEGKSPSIEMQGLFQRFRAWMLNVYRELKNLNVELTDEVRGVFDRMLATNEQIQIAEQGRSLMPLFESAEQAGMTVEEFAAYQALGVDATNEAVEDLQARGLRDMQWLHNARGRIIKKLQREAKETRAAVQMEVRKEVMAQPLYRAWAFLTGRLTDDDKLETPKPPKSDPNVLDETMDSLFVAIGKLGGLNKDEVLKTWGTDPADKPASGVFGKPLWRINGGLSIDGMREALAQYGYNYETLQDFEEAFNSELRGNPVYSSSYAPEQFDLGRPGDQVVNPDGLTAGRFNLDSLAEIGLPVEIVQHLKALKMTAKDGLHPDIVAEMFGFSSGDELVRRIAAAEAPKAEIEALTDVRMLEAFGELATPEAIERAADKAIHNDVRARMIATEANALEKATGQRKTLSAAAKSFAAGMIARLKIRNVKPGQYASAEVRAAKAAQKASMSGDLATAAAEKRNQLIQHHATRAAYDAQDEIERGLRYLKKFDGTVKGLDVDYADQIAQLLERFDLRKQSLKAVDKRTALAAWVESQREQGLEPAIPPDLLNEAFRKSYRDMTVEEFRGLLDTVQQIEHLGRLKNKLLTAADQRAYAAVRDEMVASILDNADGRKADARTPDTLTGKALQKVKQFWSSHIKSAMWARIMDGGKDGGPVWEYLIRPANERGDMETTMRAEATARLSEILDPVFKLGGMQKKQFFPSIGRSLTREARIAIALNMGNEGNIQRLLGGEGWTVQQLAPVLQSLTSTEWRAVQAVWDHFESYRPLIAAKERRVYGKEPDWVAPQGFSVRTADGESVEMRGGYYPIKYDPAASQRAEEHADAEGAKRQLQGAYTTATTRRSFTKSRAEEVNGRPLLYSLAGVYSGVNDVIHDLAWHEWLIDANRLLRSNTLDAAIRNTYGPEVKAQFKKWAADIAEGDKASTDAGDIAVNYLRQSVSVAGLGFNVMSAAIQPLGLTNSIVRVGARWIGRGVQRYIASPIALTREVNEMSDFMANRARTRFRELNELRNQVEGQTKLKEFVGRYAYFLMMRFQQAVDVPTWWGAYEKAIAEGNDETRSRALADQAVIDAQGGGMLKDQAGIERTDAKGKLFTVFYSFMNTTLNLGVVQGMTEKAIAKKTANMLLLYVIPPLLTYALKAALTPGDSGDDDPEKIAKKLLAAQVDFLMGQMVYVREFSDVAKTLTGANDLGRDYQGPAGLRLVADAGKFAMQAVQGEFDDAFRKSAVNLIGDLFGLPSAQINRTITGVEALADGETSNPAAVAFGFQKPR